MRLLLLIIGFSLAVFGGVSLVAYLNLLTVGFSLQDYILFLIQRVETYMFITGLLIIWIMEYLPLVKKKRKKNMKN
ncbi:hypothetical protein HXA31_09780 [Salipaludibacillus agaradhaerens]|jgi:uncharacterized BrkB/YihY/UPF0761 family membrane protein|uniref:Uncharacterized protein n=1 Tax=Salipaludibacillus agaradhaerens TaxID=76935 RepID=A0A9Q4FXX5_SALAG|nr:hypothetical protein [Salipaludibacillus agaradhaerens]MCR6095776.1 hypothetical protein [Salipaludibacillus agaradhaerens]MCR6114664.1 hypothetical protein [Salipaludibacillus agaradhaerens]